MATIDAGTGADQPASAGAPHEPDLPDPAASGLRRVSGRLRRLRWTSVVQTILLPIAVLGVVSIASGLDLDELGHELADARWWLVALAFVVAQLPRVAQTFAAKGASPVPLPIGPLYALQLAIGYVNVVIPGGAGRIAVNVRFFQRHGLASGAALAVSAVDGLAGFCIQVVVVGSVLALGVTSLDLQLDLDLDPSRHAATAGLVAAGLAVVVLLVLATKRLRTPLVAWLRTSLTDAGEVLSGLRSPRRLGLLVGGNLAAELCLAFALSAITRAIGHPVPLPELLIIIMAVSVLAWIIPVPGGIGVSEGGLALGLVGAGLPDEAAFAAMILYRIATFYLPPTWGFFALRWLERNEHV